MKVTKSSLYTSLVSNFIPPFVAVSVTVAALLAWLYASSLFGGQAWISSSNQGSVPQVFEMLDLAGTSCFSNVVAAQDAPCLRPDEGASGVPSAVHAVYLDESALQYVNGKLLDLSSFRLLMAIDRGVSGFAVVNGRVVHVVARPDRHESLVLLSDVTETLVERLAAAGGVEAELYQVGKKQLLSATWTGMSEEKILPISFPPGDDVRWHKAVFDAPYGGYDSAPVDPKTDRSAVFARGDLSFSNFARSFTASGVPGLPMVRSVIYVPSAVMLFYTNVAIALFVVVIVLVFGGTLFNLRRLTRRQIEPIIALSRRVKEIRGHRGGQNSDYPYPHGAINTEVTELSLAIDRLEQQLLENDQLQRRMHLHERLESLGRLTGGIAHDFNNLLNIILANCSFLIEDLDDEEILEPMRDIEGAARSAAEMTRGLLAFSSGRASELTAGRDVANEVLTTVHLIGRTLGPDISLEVDVGDSVTASMSVAKLQQILMNLILNARDAARADGVVIRVGLYESTVSPPHHPDDDPSNWLRLSVEDDGIGMDAATASQVFDPFFSSKAVSQSAGTGLGLSVVYGLVETAGGSIEVSSHPGQGTTFTVFIPKTRVAGAAPRALPSSADLKGLSVFLVEDDGRVRRAVATLLERLGMRVTAFESGAEIVEYFGGPEERSVDLLVTDIRMPGMDGYEVVSHCRSMLTDLPVIFMTGYDPDAQDRVVPENSVLVMKPVGIEEFLTATSQLHRNVGGTSGPFGSA